MFAMPQLASLDAGVRLDIGSVVKLGEDWRVVARIPDPAVRERAEAANAAVARTNYVSGQKS
jgi:hypothetical protein